MKVFYAQGDYLDDGICLIAAETDEEAERVMVRAIEAGDWPHEFRVVGVVKGATAEGPARVLDLE